jgi:asparagine synthase (glutamine-hydrolysing)
MCGIAGFVGGDWSDRGEVEATLGRMERCLDHRGPDRSARWIDPEAQVGFAHNRLAIIDVSAAGDQPMRSHSGRFVIVYNGEIYNHQAIRDELAAAGHACDWAGHSDTETLLAAAEAWGVRGALDRATGMFAFALWDRSERSLTLARDRLGEKPLYYGRTADGAFLFGSELKALAQHPAFVGDVDRDALTLLLRYGYIPAPFSIHRGVEKLPPGALLTLPQGGEPVIDLYWSGASVAAAGIANPLGTDAGELVDELERLLESSVRGQMIADVPLGAFLSGGIDSSTIVAVMQKLSARPVKTFTIGFREAGYNEAEHAKAVARHLGTDHTELYVTPEDARAVIPQLPRMYDEPFADSSQIPTHLVSVLARTEVKVALSGDGGDELFGGYNRYLLTRRLWDRIAGIPKPLRAAAASAMLAVPASTWTSFGHAAGRMLPKIARFDRLGDKVHKGALLLGSASADDLYSGMLSLWREPEDVVLDAAEPPSGGAADRSTLAGFGLVERMMALDMLGYLPDDILVKVDRAAMAVSLETRVPFLDHRLVEFAWRVPIDMKLRGSETKWILRQLLGRYVPRELIERPKMGFAVPIGAWLRGPLRGWAEALLDERRLRNEGYFRPEPIRRAWQAHLKGSVNEQDRLWPVLMFQSWLETVGSRNEVSAGRGASTPQREAGELRQTA